jgi:AraC-like DNA-binding protein
MNISGAKPMSQTQSLQVNFILEMTSANSCWQLHNSIDSQQEWNSRLVQNRQQSTWETLDYFPTHDRLLNQYFDRDDSIFSQNSIEPIRGLSECRLQQTIDYINNHLDREIYISDLAKLVELSQSYFCRLFKESTNVSAYQYILGQRIQLAKQLLLQQHHFSIADIAFQCGFASQSHFTHHFKRIMRTTPARFVKQT